MPSYTIQTTGKLYIVNKLSRDITVFDLFKAKEIKKFPIDMESHEAITTKDENRIVVTNYGAIDSDGNIIKVINTKTNEVEKTIDQVRADYALYDSNQIPQIIIEAK